MSASTVSWLALAALVIHEALDWVRWALAIRRANRTVYNVHTSGGYIDTDGLRRMTSEAISEISASDRMDQLIRDRGGRR